MASICFCFKSSNINEKLAEAVQFFRNVVAFVPAALEQMLQDKNSCFINMYLEIISQLNPSLFGKKDFLEEVEMTYQLESATVIYQMF